MTTRQWLHVFRKSIPAYKHAAATDAASVPDPARRAAAADAFEALFAGVLDALEADPRAASVNGFTTQPLNCSTLCRARDEALARAGLGDIFKALKDKENELALALLPSVLAGLDAESDERVRLELALRGVFAGNGEMIYQKGCLSYCVGVLSKAHMQQATDWFINTDAHHHHPRHIKRPRHHAVFDMGCAETAQRAESAGEGGAAGAFAATRDALLPRPWVSSRPIRTHREPSILPVLSGACACDRRAAPIGNAPPPPPCPDAPSEQHPHHIHTPLPLKTTNEKAVDDMDALLARLASRRHRKALIFVDNAGADVALGILPLARELLKRGTEVVLAANARPSINDVTAAELAPLVARAAAADAVLARAVAEAALRVVSSGNDLGVIDLRRVSPEVASEAGGGCDLVILEGMGRGIETNLHARFSVDAAKLGMVKHPEVATLLGGRMYDVVCKFDAAAD